MRRALVPLLLTALVGALAFAVPGRAAPSPTGLTRTGQVVTWSGTLTTPDPMGCGEAVSLGCDRTPLAVTAPKGAWITVSVDLPLAYLRIDEGASHVAGNGQHLGTRTFSGASAPSTTFQHVRAGRVVYSVGVSAMVVVEPLSYTAKATLAGRAFDRDGECFVGDSGLSRLQETDDGRVLPLSVRLVTAPADAVEVRTKVIPAVIETFARIKVAARVSLDVRELKRIDTYPFEQVQRAYRGVRPPGVDVVHVISDNFSGGFAQCLGGVAYPEKAFSTGSLHYAPEGTVGVPTVYAAAIVAHEIGHTLGGQHQMANCAEAIPQQALQPASDGSVGPCTVMSPGAAQVSETFSTYERAVIRSYVRRYAKG